MKSKNPKPLIIRKYENRRLYNTASSQYINQEQVAQLVREGHDVRVIDAATGADITRLVLAQIVLDDAKTPESIFPLNVLRQMIIASGKATQDSALRYMKAMMEIYQDAYRAMPSPLGPLAFVPGLWPQAKSKEAFPGASASAGVSENESGSTIGEGREAKKSELEQLRARVEELEAALARGGKRTRVRKVKSRRKS